MDITQVLQEQIRTAPDEIKQILKSGSWSQKIEEVVQINNFSLEQKTALENEVLFVLLGMSSYLDFTGNIIEALQIEKERASVVSKEVFENIFKPVVELLPTEEEGVGTDLEIPPEDLPAVVPGQMVRDVAPATSEAGSMEYEVGKKLSTNIPANLPTDNNVPPFEKERPKSFFKPEINEKKVEQRPNVPGYKPGEDPYREPIE